MSTPETVPTWPRIEAVAREDGTGEVIVNGSSQPVAAGNLDEVRVTIIRNITDIARSLGRPVRVSTSGPDGYWPLIVHPNGAVTADEDDQPRPGRRAAFEDAGIDEPSSANTPTTVDRPQPVQSPMPEGPAAAVDDHRSPGGRPADQPVSQDDAPAPVSDHERGDAATGDHDADDHGAWGPPSQPQPYVEQPHDPTSQPSFAPEGQTRPPAMPAEPPVGDQGPVAPPGPDHQPIHGATGPWPDQPPVPQQGPAPQSAAAPQPSPGPYLPPATRTFGQPPPGQQFGQPPVGQPPVGQPPVGQPPVGQQPVGQPPGQPPLGQPPPGQRAAQGPGGRSASEQYRPQRSAEQAEQPVPQQRQSFLTREQLEEPATQGFRGFLGKMGIRMSPNETERAERADVQAVSQHWPGPRTIAVVNGKGGAGKSPSTVLLSAVFALFGGAGVVAWDNNQTRGTLGWRTEQGPHEATLHDLLPEIPRLLGTGAQSADLAHYVHHQSRDRFDVLRSQPMVLAHLQRLEPKDVDAIHSVLGKYYRLIFIDSGNDESDPMWLRMIDHADQLVVATTTRDDHAEAGALLLEALAERDERSAALARSSVAIVSQADPSARPVDLKRVAAGYQALTRATVTIPFDPAMVDGLLRYGSLDAETKRAWLAAAAAVARGL